LYILLAPPMARKELHAQREKTQGHLCDHHERPRTKVTQLNFHKFNGQVFYSNAPAMNELLCTVINL
jgi:hypothetical protein